MSLLLDLDLIVARLLDQVDGNLISFAIRLETMEQAEQARAHTGRNGVIILPVGFAATDDPGIGSHTTIEERFGVLTEVRDAAEPPTTGRSISKQIREAVFDALQGWSPATSWGRCHVVQGELAGVDQKITRYLDQYATSHGVSSCPT